MASITPHENTDTTYKNDMDTTKAITHIGLCAGYGGIELGLSRAIPNLRSVALCEIEAFAAANLVSKMEAGLMDAAPIWTDLKTFPWSEFRGKVDILTGGYPCQPFSAAGKRLGKEDPRHLWPFIADGIAAMRPSICFFENVEGHISMGLSDVIEDLAGMGYRTTWGIFSAREVNAPHQRKRVFILAYLRGEGLQGKEWIGQAGTQGQPSGHLAECGSAMAVSNSLGGAAGLSRSLAWNERVAGESNHGSYEVVANAGRIEPQGWCGAADGQQSGAGRIPRGEPAPRHDQVWPSRPGEPQHGWEPPRVVLADSERPQRGQDTVAGIAEWGAEGADWTAQCGSMGNTKNKRCRRMDDEPSEVGGREERGHSDWTSTSEQQAHWETQSSMGGDSDGPTDWMDDAELFVTSDNRTDELRLLGNGVVPATAERAFRTLLKELTE